jgi:hypothetical protein
MQPSLRIRSKKGWSMILRLSVIASVSVAFCVVSLGSSGCGGTSGAQPPPRQKTPLVTGVTNDREKKSQAEAAPKSVSKRMIDAANSIAGLFPPDLQGVPEQAKKKIADNVAELIDFDQLFNTALRFGDKQDNAAQTLVNNFGKKCQGEILSQTSEGTQTGPGGAGAWYVSYFARIFDDLLAGKKAEDRQQQGSYTLLKTSDGHGQVIRAKSYDEARGTLNVVTFRHILAGRTGVNYHDYALIESQGKAKVVDIYDYQNGEWMSEAIRRDFVMTYGGQLTNLLTDKDRPYWDYSGLLRAMRESFDQKRFPETLAAYSLIMSDVLKFDESVLVMRLRAAAMPPITVEHLDQAQGSFDERQRIKRDSSPNPAANLLLVGPYTAVQKYEQALRCVKNVGDFIADGGDPYLDVLKADVLISWGQIPESESPATLKRNLKLVSNSGDIVAVVRAIDAELRLAPIIRAGTVAAQNSEPQPKGAEIGEVSEERKAFFDVIKRVQSAAAAPR